MQNLYDSEIEQSVLGGLIVDSQIYPLLDLKPDDFAVGVHSEIIKAMSEVYQESGKFDRASLVLKLGGKVVDVGQERVTYQQYLSDLIGAVISTNVEVMQNYCRVLRSLSRKRQIESTARRVLSGLADMTVDQIMAEMSSLVVQNAGTDEIKTEAQIREEILDNMSRPPKCYPTGLSDLDIAMSGGMFAGYTYGLAGAEKSGKTTFAHTISHNMAAFGHKHLYVALEMGAVQIEQRNLSRDLRVNSMRFIDKPESLRSGVMAAPVSGNKFYYDAPGATVDDILVKAKAAQIKYNITGFIVDYWQLVEGKDPRESEERHLRFVAQSLANFARKNGLWCLLLAQLNKEGQLFGGNGLRKACDQLYFIEQPQAVGSEHLRWLRMDASRYTPRQDIGHDMAYPFELTRTVGPSIQNTNMFFRQ